MGDKGRGIRCTPGYKRARGTERWGPRTTTANSNVWIIKCDKPHPMEHQLNIRGTKSRAAGSGPRIKVWGVNASSRWRTPRHCAREGSSRNRGVPEGVISRTNTTSQIQAWRAKCIPHPRKTSLGNHHPRVPNRPRPAVQTSFRARHNR